MKRFFLCLTALVMLLSTAAAERSMSRQTQAGREASRAAASGFAASPRATTLSSVVPTA